MLRVMGENSVRRALSLVLGRITTAYETHGQDVLGQQPRLVAVSKTKPVELIKEAYVAGQRHFGENYVQELEKKSTDPDLQSSCPDIRWHFIGHLQRSNVNKLLKSPNLSVVETIDSERLATAVNNAWQKLQKIDPLKVFLQVNTSGEENKHGCNPEEASSLAVHIRDKCPQLQLLGVMTIGIYNYDTSLGPNPDFLSLVQSREHILEELKLDKNHFEMSMGMSNDFEHAIQLGSTNVRVGSTIFGTREYKPKVENESNLTETDSKVDSLTDSLQSAPLLAV